MLLSLPLLLVYLEKPVGIRQSVLSLGLQLLQPINYAI